MPDAVNPTTKVTMPFTKLRGCARKVARKCGFLSLCRRSPRPALSIVEPVAGEQYQQPTFGRSKLRSSDFDEHSRQGASSVSKSPPGGEALGHFEESAIAASRIAKSLPTWIGGEEFEGLCTNNDPRIFLTCNGTETCLAFLPDAYLATALQEAVIENREVERARKFWVEKLAALFDIHEDLDAQIEALEQRLADRRNTHGNAKLETLPDQRCVLETLFKKRQRLETVQAECRESLNELYKYQREGIQKIICGFEQMFIDSHVLREEDDEMRSAMVNEDPYSILQNYSSELGSILALPGDSPAIDHARCIRRTSAYCDLRNTGNNETESIQLRLAAEQALIDDYFSARRRLDSMENTFDSRDQRFEDEVEERHRKLQAGLEVESQLAFDMRQLQEYRGMTQQVIESEQILEAVKAAALAAGVQIVASEISSGFVDDVHGGYASSSGGESAIERWMAKKPIDPTGKPDEVEIDDWDARSVDLCDSASLVAEGSKRRRIDRWKIQCADQMQVW
ncbi:hypothetical protein LTR78_006240 [Recurvomyces mirabilis]|uniref:Uncharacterized protein n=1 Tax=Recurvomyces mirabilis TaxID=574656 RepID=A0AAE0WLR2_9PEZI|nr:hypothetical protein LTR78_006240 [Recurvomyces mirabilis]KAK5152081.1 hypothetical protein LTS14_008856 [Recurvomyces mirabilis]